MQKPKQHTSSSDAITIGTLFDNKAAEFGATLDAIVPDIINNKFSSNSKNIARNYFTVYSRKIMFVCPQGKALYTIVDYVSER